MEQAFNIILICFSVIWVIIFLKNISYFYNYNSSEIDKVFLHKKTFDEVIHDLDVLKKYLNKNFESAERKIKFYQRNSLLTRRKYSYYRDKIEVGLIKLYLGQELQFKQCFKKLDQPVKYFFLFTFVVILFFSALWFDFLLLKSSKFGLFLTLVLFIISIAFIVKCINYIYRINYVLLFVLIDGILILTKRNRGRLQRNVAILDEMMKGWWGYSNSGGIVFHGSGSNTFSGGSGGDFGGFGGGDFGGGGAGGSW